MCGECSQCLSHTGFAPSHSVWAFIVYTTQAPGCSAGNCLRRALGCVHFPGLSCSGSGSRVLHKGADVVGPVFCALPRSEQLRWPGAWRAQSPPGGGASYCLPLPSSLVFWVYNGRAFSGVPCVSSGELISGCDPPGGCQLSLVVSNGACLQFGRGCLSGAAIAPFLLWLPPCLHVSGGGWAGPQPASSPLVFAQSFVLWTGLAVPQVRAFRRIVFSLSLSGYPTVWVAISL